MAITTDMTVSGRVAQFGRGVMADVTARLLQQFVGNLEANVLGPAGKGEAAGAGDAPATGAGPAANAGRREGWAGPAGFLAGLQVCRWEPRAQPGSPNRVARARNVPGAAPCSQAGSRIHRGT